MEAFTHGKPDAVMQPGQYFFFFFPFSPLLSFVLFLFYLLFFFSYTHPHTSTSAAMTAGALGQLIASPTDLVKVRMQMEGRRILQGKKPLYKVWE